MTFEKPPPASHRGARRPFRPALATLALLATTACGGAVVDISPENADARAGAAGQNPAGAGGVGGGAGSTAGRGGSNAGTGGSTDPAACPVAQPQNGSTCVTEGQTCDYVPPPSCAACRCQYHCWNGAWVEDGSGCTPPLPPPGEICPADRPRDGTYCAAAPPAGCTYVAAYCMEKPSGWTTYLCVENLWKVGNSRLDPCSVPPPARDASIDVVRFDAAVAADRESVEAGGDRGIASDAGSDGSIANESRLP
jgi:hypothetical protein